MMISPESIQALVTIVTGDGGLSPYRTGPQLIEFFEKYGCTRIYGLGFPSRRDFTKEELVKINKDGQIEKAIEDALDPRHYLGLCCKRSEPLTRLIRSESPH